MISDLEWLHRTKRTRLSNGMILLTHYLPTSEVAALHFCVNAGYFCETDDEVGLAHLLEHMYFKGSKCFPEPEGIGVRMKHLGGMINATTSYDQTNYFCEVPAENLADAMEIMSDALLAPNFPEDELRKECEVVIEEFNRKLDSPASFSQEKLIQLAYTQHRMKRWRIGTPEQLRSFTRENLFDYFQRYYNPSNVIVTITGKFDEEDVRSKVAGYFESVPGRVVKKDFGPAEPPQQQLRYAYHRSHATQSYLHFGLHAPGVMHPDGPALEFASFLLSTGRSARLHRFVVEQRRSASAVSCGTMAFEDIGMMIFTAITESNQIRNAARDIWTVVDDLLNNGVTSEELVKVKNKLRLHQMMQTEDALNLAELLSYYESYGGFEKLEEWYRTMQEITEDSLLQTVGKYLTPSRLSVLEFANEDLEAWEPDHYETHLLSGHTVPETALQPPMSITTGTAPGQAKTFTEPMIQERKVKFILHPDSHYPFLSAGMFFLGGRNEEDGSTAGLTHLLHRMAFKGTSHFTAEQIALRFDLLGNSPRFYCSRDFCGFVLESLPENFPEAWKLLIHCLQESVFPQKELDTEKGKMMSMIRRNLDDNFVRPIHLFQKAYFGNHPYSLPESGMEESVRSLGQQNLNSWKGRVWNLPRMIISVVGSFDSNVLVPVLEDELSSFAPSGNRPVFSTEDSFPQIREQSEQRSKKQTAFVLGFPALPSTEPDCVRFDVIQQILSGMGGRLFINLRSKKSLAYTVHAVNAAALQHGTFLTYIAGEASKEEEALAGMWNELDTLQKEPVSGEELDRARNGLIGGYTLGTQSASSRIFDYVQSYLNHRPLPFAPAYRKLVHSVTAEQLIEVARQTFHRENSTLGIVRGTTGESDNERLAKQ